ncbi:MAG: hypothetical protein GWN87_06035 [Desulfuromonadales bacterium]|jgi:hypothetical protein|nr:hypothetical protein [Desulfuromonadales bacterium]NIS40140.1 hypothetical protein [Desulfuromonadales bacterium]
MPDDTGDPQAYMTAAKAASLLGLDERLVEWALDRKILDGRRDKGGTWTVSRREIEAGQQPLEEQFAYLRARESGETADALPDVSRGEPAVATTRPETPADGDRGPDIDRLGQRIDELHAMIAEKDALIADLARSLSRMGERAIEKLPDPKE